MEILFCLVLSLYAMTAKAVPIDSGTAFYREDGHIFTSYDSYSGPVVVLMNDNGTVDVTDDSIVAVFEI